MVRYLNSPLKATGTLIILSGLLMMLPMFGNLSFLGLSIATLGVLIHITDHMVQRAQISRQQKNLFSLFLIGLSFSVMILLALDFKGMIPLRY